MVKTVERVVMMIESVKNAILEVGYLFPERKTANRVKVTQLDYILSRIEEMEE